MRALGSKTRGAMAAGLALVAVIAMTGARPAAPTPTRTGAAFAAYDLWVDAGALPLAAWQVEVLDENDGRTIVGVEGGDHVAYAAPPVYDPAALRGGRIIIAAFSTAAALPSGLTRVARVHMRVADENDAVPQVRPQVAATRGGGEMSIEVRLERVR